MENNLGIYSMKYLFINSVAGIGSTGRIAAEQCRRLQEQGHRCVLAYGRAQANCDDIQTIQIGTAMDYRWHGVMTRLFDQHGFWSYRATKKFLRWVQSYAPDVIWLHNIHGYYINIELLFEYLKRCGKQVIWTLHDCWAFTGHCSYFTAIGCEQWKSHCLHCTQLRRYPKCCVIGNVGYNYERKQAAFTGVSNMKIIVPSQWLKEIVQQSFLKNYPVEVIYNTINTNVFRPTSSNFREQFGLENKKIILGVASVWEERKGLYDFFKLADLLDDRFRIVLVGLSKKQMKRLPTNIIGIEHTNSPQELAAIYTAADIFINPTYEDNYPTVNLEAQACGIPVITYDTGGCKETTDSRGLCKVGSIEDLRKMILNYRCY